jgi:glycosyltransferase involved in cell wall biosynthesis
MVNSISIVFATFNGASTIEKTLQSMKNLNHHGGIKFNIVVVDNASNDNTLEILQKYSNTLPLIILQENKKGKNAALNKALTLIDDLGELIIFSDDDVIFSANVLERYVELANKESEFSLFGGQIIPHWLERPSDALLQGIPQTVAFALTSNDDGYQKGPISAIKIHGPNMAVRKKIFADGLSFNENIGPNGNNYVMGSETDFLYRTELEGFHAFYDPSIIVEHIIRTYQFESYWLKNRAFKAGRSLYHAQVRNGENTTCTTFMRYPRWALKKYILEKAKMYFNYVLSNKEAWYRSLWKANHLLGYIFEYKSHIK